MSRIILIGGVLFAASAAGAWFLLPKSIVGDDDEQSNAGNSTAMLETTEDAPPPPPEDALPVAIRPRSMTPEDVLRHATSLRSREQALDDREAAVKQRESELELIGIDVRGERQELEALQVALQDDMAALEKLLQKVVEERRLLSEEQEAAKTELETINRDRASFDQEESQNLKDLAEILTPETAAGLIREYVNDGQRDTAAKLLSYFDERDASQILEAIADPDLIRELAERFARLPRPAPKSKRR